SITPDDKIFFGRDPVTKDDLAKKIGNVLKDKLPAEQVVYVKSDRLVKYGTVVGVIDTIREAGFERIGLVAEKEKETGGAAPCSRATSQSGCSEHPFRTSIKEDVAVGRQRYTTWHTEKPTRLFQPKR